jgi:hypothetical protein
MSNIAAAFVKAKKAFRPALKEKANPAFKGSKYADLSSCIEAVDDAFLANGIAMYQECHPDDAGVTVETVLLHESGESIRSGRLHVPANKQDPQGFGSALTYARRYSLMAACGIAPEDDDGNAASRKKSPEPTPTMSEDDVEAHQIAMHKAASSDALRAAFGVAYKAAKAIGDAAAAKSLQEFYDVRKKTLAETDGVSA